MVAIPEETVKDVNARITLKRQGYGTALENNIVDNYDKRNKNLMTTMHQCEQKVHALGIVFPC